MNGKCASLIWKTFARVTIFIQIRRYILSSTVKTFSIPKWSLKIARNALEETKIKSKEGEREVLLSSNAVKLKERKKILLFLSSLHVIIMLTCETKQVVT